MASEWDTMQAPDIWPGGQEIKEKKKEAEGWLGDKTCRGRCASFWHAAKEYKGEGQEKKAWEEDYEPSAWKTPRDPQRDHQRLMRMLQ